MPYAFSQNVRLGVGNINPNNALKIKPSLFGEDFLRSRMDEALAPEETTEPVQEPITYTELTDEENASALAFLDMYTTYQGDIPDLGTEEYKEFKKGLSKISDRRDRLTYLASLEQYQDAAVTTSYGYNVLNTREENVLDAYFEGTGSGQVVEFSTTPQDEAVYIEYIESLENPHRS